MDLINQRKNGVEVAMNYLSGLKPETVTSLVDIEKYDDWKILMTHDLVKHTDKNLYDYINQFGVDDTLIECLNSSYAQSPWFARRLKNVSKWLSGMRLYQSILLIRMCIFLSRDFGLLYY